jgi:hypothetical protein
MVKRPGFTFTLTALQALRRKLGSWPANPHTTILISELPRGHRVAPGDERSVAQSALGLSV